MLLILATFIPILRIYMKKIELKLRSGLAKRNQGSQNQLSFGGAAIAIYRYGGLKLMEIGSVTCCLF